MSMRIDDICSALFFNIKIETRSLTGESSENSFGSYTIVFAWIEGSVAEVNFSRLASAVEWNEYYTHCQLASRIFLILLH